MESDLLLEVASRLSMDVGRCASDAELDAIEAKVGGPLPPLFRRFQRGYGACRCNCMLGEGLFVGKDVIFMDVSEILSRLELVEGHGLVPFADDLWGNVFYLALPLGRVLLFDDEEAELKPVAEDFRSLLQRLVRRE